MTSRTPQKKKVLKPQEPGKSYEPARFEPADAKALQMLYEGKATEAQQKRALVWIINQAAGNAPAFRPGGAEGARETDFALGRKFVGEQIIGLLRVNLIGIDTVSQPEPKGE